MSFHELVTADAVNTFVGDDQKVADVELSNCCEAVFIRIHPFVDATGDTSIIEFLRDFYAGAVFGGCRDQQKVFFQVAEHVCKDPLFLVVRDGLNGFAEVDYAIGRVYADGACF